MLDTIESLLGFCINVDGAHQVKHLLKVPGLSNAARKLMMSLHVLQPLLQPARHNKQGCILCMHSSFNAGAHKRRLLRAIWRWPAESVGIWRSTTREPGVYVCLFSATSARLNRLFIVLYQTVE